MNTPPHPIPMPAIDEAFRISFEEQGVQQIRARLGEWSGPVKSAAIAWLAHKDLESEERAREERSEQRSSSAETLRRAKIANRIATAALIVAIIALVISALPLFR